VDNTSRDALYVTRRWGSSFSYHLPVENGDYTLRLRFAEPAWDAAGKRVFDSIIGSGIIEWIAGCDDAAALERVREMIREMIEKRT